MTKATTKTQKKIPGTIENWESGKLGEDESSAVAADPIPEAELNEALGLQPISIRLENELIDDFKTLARLAGLGYQPLMRQVLKRFAHAELKRLANQYQADRARQQKEDVCESDDQSDRSAA